ncbi:MAG: NAD(P)-binding domain-containing protein [Bacteroidetes bacterium]|nr:NAD(P)-binding domain-containing protein [Bacteroidota bacterium]
MKTAVLGTGMVGQTIATKLIQLGHEVKMGSRSGHNEKATEWISKNGPSASQGTFAEASAAGEIIFNCTKGEVALEVLEQAGNENLKGKILIDISNPLDFSKGMPPTLLIVNDNSLGEEIQKLVPDTYVVKTLNTLTANLMVNPQLVNNGDHDIFLSGNSKEAKEKVSALLQTFGWGVNHLIDLGDITTARGTEQILPVWVRLYAAMGTPMFQFKIVK